MATVKKLDLSGQETGQWTVQEEWLQPEANSQMIKDYLVALRANARQWSAHTKTRAEVSHSGQKPHPQKGTGRARQGYLGAAQYKGGGRVGGPRAKEAFHISINRKEKQAAIRHLLAEKIREGRLLILKTPALQAPRTKEVAQFLKRCEIAERKVLFLADKTEMKGENGAGAHFAKSIRNLPRADFVLIDNVSGYDVVAHQWMVVTEAAAPRLTQLLKGGQG